MAAPSPDHDRGQPQQLFVRADEVDAGTSILSPSRELPLSALSPSDAFPPGTRPRAPPRPGLRREGSAPPPPPPSQPPPAPPTHLDPADSLSLPQLRQLVGQFPKSEQRAYAFQYKDAEDFETEIDEWFHYTELDQDRDYLLSSLEAFEQKWKSFCQTEQISEETTWIAVSEDHRQKFVSDLVHVLGDDEYLARAEALCCVYFILMGAWSITSGLEMKEAAADDDSPQSEHDRCRVIQVQWMHKGADLLVQSSIIPQLYSCLIQATKAPDSSPPPPPNVEDEEKNEGAFGENEYRELSLCLSCFYVLIESARVRIDTKEGQNLRQAISSLQPSFLVFLASTISRLRWDESYNIPLMHALQLFWKSILLLFGNVTEHLDKIKSILQPRVDPFSAEAAHPVLTASPLDYHLFRQEITSKYPAYNPPLPLVPLEMEQKTMLPPLPHHSSRPDAPPGAGGQGWTGASPRGSILHQPVHIATPAPSPPPSPIGPGGKAGKKQNYQTNQNFPFLYPPLDTSSNTIGGKGSTEIQDLMVGKKWEGSDIPRSIMEAGELFASRMRMTRAMRQLWRERDLFMKYERGWQADVNSESEEDRNRDHNGDENDIDSIEDPDLRSRMCAVDDFFHHALPDLQSLVIVMMKVMLTNVQDIAVRNGGLQDSTQPGGLNRTKSNPNIAQNQTLPIPPPPPRPADMTLEDLDNVRSREISQKAVSGAIFLLLKWFKISHILQFEYMTQLLLDSNYVQLTLKYFAHQNLEDLVAFKYDRDDLSVWHYCHIHSDHPPLSPTSPDERSETSSVDEAVPPPISRHRRSPTSKSDGPSTSDQATAQQQTPQSPEAQAHPSVDELGNPLGPLPSTPIMTYSFRQFQTSIHLLRILQKLTRGKSHRILFLVQFKSSQILRRVLRVPDATLRLYVLKLFKSQVPYCGRKWRQSNMRVITAIYLHCRPELRDEWLAGMHDANVEGEVDEAVPLEWALRGLTFWWQKRMYPGVMKRGKGGAKSKGKPKANVSKVAEALSTAATAGVPDDREVDAIDIDVPESSLDDGEDDDDEGGQEIDDDERDFFKRELDAIGWGLAGLRLADGSEDVVFGEEALGINGAGAYPVINGASQIGIDNAGQGASGPSASGTGSGAPQTPVSQPQWVVADAASIDNWQNS
ncbi:uncharacterized protein Z518_00083 [Rhinocladiella mackenziei CBS 650.93]|uniref:Factor arrest protein 11 n=1 Tax=Rhinocladiella mackenziei CBS 650.93 TaxID=1442369 RepID=A0A0D2JI45_9EURO|nr:uncharacterized protein Z518_00083 [Rhinocladiella mackenziei CBS 650.93]KIX09005.1 hypothetical protein Z518_00083 [Rhinocladiella mackenziei CBS 650.93]